MASAKKTKANEFISRINYRNSEHGNWWVRFTRGMEMFSHHESQKSFPDLRHGGKAKALKAARAWRDEMKAKLNRADVHMHSVGKRRIIPHSNTGVVGITRCHTTKNLLSGGIYAYFSFQAGYVMTIDGKRVKRTKTFSYKPEIKGDEARAFKAAKELRRDMEKLHYDN